MSDCLFCKIANGEVAAEKHYEDDHVLAFSDIDPKAPTHILVIPKLHIATLNDMQETDKELLGHMHFVAQQVAKQHNHADTGYRLVMNCNRDAGQMVFHIHLHLLAGRQLHWPPG